MGKRARVGLLVVVVLAVVAGCGSKKTTIQGQAGGELPNNGFPFNSIEAKALAELTDEVGDYIFFNGKEPGRHDAFIDIKHVALGEVTPDATQLGKLEIEIACGNSPAGLVVCPGTPVPIPTGKLFLFSMQTAGTIPSINPAGETGRFSLDIDAGGDAATKAQASPNAPNLASQGTNLLYEVIFGPPGQPGQPSEPKIELNAVDRRQTGNEFFKTAARIVIKGDTVTFVIPELEIGDQYVGARAATLWGNSTATGDAAQNNADVAPGGKSAPFGLLMAPDQAGQAN